MGKLAGKVALVTGAARGQGRSHALRLASEGAQILALDHVGHIETVNYPLPTPEDLKETVRLVEATGATIIAREGDVRDQAQVESLIADGVARFGRLDIVVANAGIAQRAVVGWESTEAEWQDLLDVNLTGVWHTAKAAVPAMITAGNGGAIIITSSSVAIKPMPHLGAYAASKFGVVGLMKTLALELVQHRIRVNTVHPGAVSTDMFLSDRIFELFRPDLDNPTLEDAKDEFYKLHVLPTPWVEPIDISNAVLWLASDEARFVTGISLPVDAGSTIK
jgi:SDR family mycofactocin-dependent oxidoreductase